MGRATISEEKLGDAFDRMFTGTSSEADIHDNTEQVPEIKTTTAGKKLTPKKVGKDGKKVLARDTKRAVTVYMESDTVNKLKIYCGVKRIPMSEIYETAVKEYMKKFPLTDKEKSDFGL